MGTANTGTITLTNPQGQSVTLPTEPVVIDLEDEQVYLQATTVEFTPGETGGMNLGEVMARLECQARGIDYDKYHARSVRGQMEALIEKHGLVGPLSGSKGVLVDAIFTMLGDVRDGIQYASGHPEDFFPEFKADLLELFETLNMKAFKTTATFATPYVMDYLYKFRTTS